ncbi:MAG: hypothetical protein WA091_00645 [Minisyncoccales bacterium]
MNAFDDPQDWEVRLVDIVDPKRQRREEQKEGYRLPMRLRHFQNVINVLGRDHEDLSKRRAELLKELDRQKMEAELKLNEFAALEERMRHVERKLHEAYIEVENQRINV